ncbi:TlpA disulfide reductase family protein [Tsukamurella sp. 8F]|uniref:TlpA family protein disulfide reductase n=1 Tax=unclassified Tsukamurella TaxID=2633480 RepID=UPI0023B93840|nr:MULTISPECIES: TlpA disulfide reductase family protein [unclassified Tsukamurella]MDF0531740.1 TlpA disulfide reductase family protein [Tsukamurella sp. 8J]MDF0588986.1 TlpA disulfide reductase family protein [Tsukamurella sp. 8F]
MRTPRLARTARALTAAAAVGALLGTGACATGKDAVAEQGGTFQFVSPGGKTKLSYDPPGKRGTIGAVSGRSLMEPDKTVSVADYSGKVVVINVWGQWCGPCRGEADDLEAAYQATRAKGVAFLGIDFRETGGDQPAQDFVRDHKITYPSIYDPPGRTLLAISKDYPTTVVPSTIVLDRKHRVAAVYLTTVSKADLEQKVTALAAEPDGGTA